MDSLLHPLPDQCLFTEQLTNVCGMSYSAFVFDGCSFTALFDGLVIVVY